MSARDEIVVITAVNEEDLAQEFLVDMISEGIILSGTYWPVKVIFQWENQIHIDEEYKIMLKARAGYFSDIEKYIMENHHYRAPEIIKLEASFGSQDFRDHIMSNKKM